MKLYNIMTITLINVIKQTRKNTYLWITCLQKWQNVQKIKWAWLHLKKRSVCRQEKTSVCETGWPQASIQTLIVLYSDKESQCTMSQRFKNTMGCNISECPWTVKQIVQKNLLEWRNNASSWEILSYMLWECES